MLKSTAKGTNEGGGVIALPVPHLDELGSIAPGLLYPHQADGVAFLISRGRAILGDDMGLGKTRQAIVAMQVAAPTGMILVVCPASLKLNWRREIRMVDPRARIEVLGVADGEQPDPRWVIVNYDILARNAERLHGIAWSGVILDEAKAMRARYGVERCHRAGTGRLARASALLLMRGR